MQQRKRKYHVFCLIAVFIAGTHSACGSPAPIIHSRSNTSELKAPLSEIPRTLSLNSRMARDTPEQMHPEITALLSRIVSSGNSSQDAFFVPEICTGCIRGLTADKNLDR